MLNLEILYFLKKFSYFKKIYFCSSFVKLDYKGKLTVFNPILFETGHLLFSN